MANTLSIIGAYGTLDFKTAGSGVSLISWRQVTPSYKEGGVFADSQISPDRRPVYRQEASHVETITFGLYGATEDAIASKLEVIRIVCDESFDYWTPASVLATPVYISAQVRDEPGIRYAILYKMELTGELPDLYKGEFQSGIIVEGQAYNFGLSNLTLTIERGAWMSHAPGSGATVTLTTYEDGKVSTDHDSGSRSAAVLIESTDILGDMPALGKITFTDFDEFSSVVGVNFPTHILFGFRATSRGADFTAYLNLETTPPSTYTITAGGPGGSIVTDTKSPHGQGHESVLPFAAAWQLFRLRFSSIAHFKGRFRAFVRFKRSTTEAIGLRLTLQKPSSGTIHFATPYVYVGSGATTTVNVVDLGEISIPPSEIYNVSGATETMDLWLWVTNTAAFTITVQQIILMPIDEYICDVDAGQLGVNFFNNDLIVDSISLPRIPTQAVAVTTGPLTIQHGPTPIASHSRFLIFQRREMKLWFFAYYNIEEPIASNINATVSMSAVTRYSVLRK